MREREMNVRLAKIGYKMILQHEQQSFIHRKTLLRLLLHYAVEHVLAVIKSVTMKNIHSIVNCKLLYTCNNYNFIYHSHLLFSKHTFICRCGFSWIILLSYIYLFCLKITHYVNDAAKCIINSWAISYTLKAT